LRSERCKIRIRLGGAGKERVEFIQITECEKVDTLAPSEIENRPGSERDGKHPLARWLSQGQTRRLEDRCRFQSKSALPDGDTPTERCRFAPTTSGPAHPGTLLAALLCWLDARQRRASLLLRLEDVDSTRCTAQSAQDMRDALSWFGLDWDEECLQSESHAEHAAALDELARAGLLYPCDCSRSAIKRAGLAAADGGWRYPGHCRSHKLAERGWRSVDAAVRLRLEPGITDVRDESGLPLGRDPSGEMGDPVLRSRNGSIAYHLACVVDDARAGISRVVRGRDLAPCTAIHTVLQRRLGLTTPIYRHHLLLLEKAGNKFAKLHGAVGWRALQDHYTAAELCGVLAEFAGLTPDPSPLHPGDLIDRFDWNRVRSDDVALQWTGSALERVTRD
jgi:glutamyl/glutaminyl-tRNA synthetase